MDLKKDHSKTLWSRHPGCSMQSWCQCQCQEEWRRGQRKVPGRSSWSSNGVSNLSPPSTKLQVVTFHFCCLPKIESFKQTVRKISFKPLIYSHSFGCPQRLLTARLKWKKGFLAAGFPIFWRRWSDQTFSIINDITKTEKTFCCWFFLKTKYLSNILVKIVASRLWIRYKTWLLKKIQWCWPPAEDLF